MEICGEKGNFYRITGRCKDIINRGGMKISPVEIDVALEEHPDIVEAAVCAYPDERLGGKGLRLSRNETRQRTDDDGNHAGAPYRARPGEVQIT